MNITDYNEFIILVFTMLSNLSVSAYVYVFGYLLSDKKYVSAKYFSWATFFAALWALSLSLDRSFLIFQENYIFTYFANLGSFSFAALTSYFISLFSIHFKNRKSKKLLKRQSEILRWALILILPLILIPEFGIMKFGLPGNDIRYRSIPHIIYGFVIFSFFGFFVTTLIRRLISVKNKRTHSQLIIILTGTLLAFLGGIGANYLYPILFGWDTFGYLGPVFTTFVSFSIIISIIKYKLFNIPQSLIRLLLILGVFIGVLLVRIVLTLPQSEDQVYINLSILLVFGIILTFLTREVYMGAKRQMVLNAKKEQLDKLLQDKTNFLRNASHQFRTPLTVIIGYLTDMTVEKKAKFEVNDNAERDLNKVRISASNLNEIINDLLAANDINVGKFGINIKDDVDLRKFVDRVLEDKKALIEDKKTEVKVKYKGDDFGAYVDLPKLREAFNNIFDNSIYYGGGKVWITIDASRKTIFHLVVRDNGVGISRAEFKRVWNKFERGKKSSTINPNGSGLGLYLAKMIMQKHGGDLTGYSKGVGKGSSFTFILPRDTKKDAPEESFGPRVGKRFKLNRDDVIPDEELLEKRPGKKMKPQKTKKKTPKKTEEKS